MLSVLGSGFVSLELKLKPEAHFQSVVAGSLKGTDPYFASLSGGGQMTVGNYFHLCELRIERSTTVASVSYRIFFRP